MPRRKSPVVWSLSVKPQIASPKDDPLSTFLTACETGNETVALRLAGGCADDSLTVGLNKAMKNNRLELARNLINAGAQWNTETVHLASASFDAVRLLVETGFDVNTGLGEGTVLLLFVVRWNEECSIRYLLEHGANPNLGPPLLKGGQIRDIHPVPDSSYILNLAATYCTPETFALLLSYGADITNAIPLHSAAGRGGPSPYDATSSGSRIPMMEYLLGLGLDINAMDDAIEIAPDGRGQVGTPLQYAVLWHRVEEAKWLLGRGADPDKQAHSISARDRVNRLSDNDPLSILFRTI